MGKAIQQLLKDPKNAIRQGAGMVDPANPLWDQHPGLRMTRQFSTKALPYDPASDSSIPFRERLPMYLQKYGQNFMGGHGGFGKLPASPIEINKAAVKMRSNPTGRVLPEDVNVMGKFGELVETGKGRNNLGETGATIQSLITSLFGNKAKDWSNKQIKIALDEVLKRAMEARGK